MRGGDMRAWLVLVRAAWYSMAVQMASETPPRRSCHGGLFAYDRRRKRFREIRMTIHRWTVEAFNTAKQSENRMHDDAVARRFGFSGGLVPGVDVMAYMMHLPVARWGRDFLDRGLIEARFIKPVYDGETTAVTGEEKDGVLSIAVESRGQLCATSAASLPASTPSLSLTDFPANAPVAQ